MAAVAITFARYFDQLTSLALPDGVVAAAVLLLLVAINCLGVRAGGTVQSGLMLLKILAIALLVLAGWCFAPANADFLRPPPIKSSAGMMAAIGAAMTPVMFSYGGWAAASFVAAHIKRPRTQERE